MLPSTAAGLNTETRTPARRGLTPHEEAVMTHRWLLVPLASLAFVALALPLAAMTRGTPDPAIRGRADAYLKAVLAGDARAVAAVFREDGVDMPPCTGRLEGRAAIEGFYRRMFEGPARVTAFTFSHTECRQVGDTGYDVGTYVQTLTGAPGGPQTDTGKYVAILKRTNGAWQAAYVIYNSDQPPTMPPPSAMAH
jgi:uncharacterized protein (TIGR02246 family)